LQEIIREVSVTLALEQKFSERVRIQTALNDFGIERAIRSAHSLKQSKAEESRPVRFALQRKLSLII
jgi:hypothetical protein